MLSIGIPKEIKPLEKRVGLTPSAVKVLKDKGIRVFVERSAGEGSGFSDSDFKKAGAEILPEASDIYAKADLIQKVKEPQESEYPLLRKGQILFCYLHLASPENCALVETLVRSHAVAIGYETVELGGRLPLLAPMSEIAGALAAGYAAALRSSGFSTASKIDPLQVFALLEKTASLYPNFDERNPIGKTVIFGGGVAGFKAMDAALKLKGEVSVIEKNEERREFLKKFTHSVFAPDDSIKPVLERADVLIGCVHSRGARASQVISEKLFREISKINTKVIIDVAIDQGGNFPESGSTSYADPVYFDSCRNLRFAVANMPSLCGRGASEALTQAALPYSIEIAMDPEGAFARFPELAAGINVRDGLVVLEAVKQAHHRV